MYFFKTPSLVRKIFPGLLWQGPIKDKVIYLTFDDGPVPGATPWVLDQLRHYKAKASFFMVGENIVKHPEIYDQVLAAGHRAANHTYNHLKGWQTPTLEYIENFSKAEELLPPQAESLFRPPYGQLKPAQIRALKEKTKIVMWDVLSGDFDPELAPEICLNKAIANTRMGSIVVFHDSVKTIDLLRQVLPVFLDHFTKLGFTFATL